MVFVVVEMDKRLIDVNAFMEQVRLMANRTSLGETKPDELSATEVLGLLFDAPTVEAKEVVYGEWIPKGVWSWHEGGIWNCSECSRQLSFRCETPAGANMNYCPGCGAKMDSKK